MENKITVNICGEDYTFVAEETPSYMQKVAAMVDAKMGEILKASHVSRTDAAVLTAENLRAQLKGYLDEANRAKNEASDLRREVFRLQQQLDKQGRR